MNYRRAIEQEIKFQQFRNGNFWEFLFFNLKIMWNFEQNCKLTNTYELILK